MKLNCFLYDFVSPLVIIRLLYFIEVYRHSFIHSNQTINQPEVWTLDHCNTLIFFFFFGGGHSVTELLLCMIQFQPSFGCQINCLTFKSRIR